MNQLHLNNPNLDRLESQIKILSNHFESLKKAIESQMITTPLLDNQDMCQLLNVSKRTLQHWRNNGQIKFIKIGSKVYYPSEDFKKLIDSKE